MFLRKEFLYLEDVFALARMQTINAEPKNKKQLEALLGIEQLMNAKMIKTNEELGFVEPEEPEEYQGDEAGEEVATDPGQTD